MDKNLIIAGLLLALFLALFLSPFASSYPDGLEKVAEKLGFINKESAHLHSPLPDYTLPFVKNEKLSTSLAGVIGTIIVFAITILLGRIIKS
jgi:cobalt/nickel transport protein